jgi:hypothetical protein
MKTMGSGVEAQLRPHQGHRSSVSFLPELWSTFVVYGDYPVERDLLPAATYQEAQQLLTSLIERRLKRRYEEVTTTS